MQVYVFDTIRAALSDLNLDQVFENKDSISHSLKTHLADTFDDYGFEVLNALIVDMTPDQRVRDAMNEINAAARQKVRTGLQDYRTGLYIIALLCLIL